MFHLNVTLLGSIHGILSMQFTPPGFHTPEGIHLSDVIHSPPEEPWEGGGLICATWNRAHARLWLYKPQSFSLLRTLKGNHSREREFTTLGKNAKPFSNAVAPMYNAM